MIGIGGRRTYDRAHDKRVEGTTADYVGWDDKGGRRWKKMG